MKSVSIAEAKSTLSELIDQLAVGEEVVITRHGQAVARLLPAPRTRLSTHSITEPGPLSKETMPAELDMPDDASPQRP
ncbi:MAG: type II toxin-antitoxin system prevent-host-death family antitoxin [Rhizobacter sp.]|nr:type II toxin-antitoxin system prevent-host-death family antitoxin [Rhizobacter sp.]